MNIILAFNAPLLAMRVYLDKESVRLYAWYDIPVILKKVLFKKRKYSIQALFPCLFVSQKSLSFQYQVATNSPGSSTYYTVETFV